MATKTSNYELVLAEGGDVVDVDSYLNANFTKIDELFANASAVSYVDATIAASSWSNNVTSVTIDKAYSTDSAGGLVIVSPTAASRTTFRQAGISATTISDANAISLTCVNTPTADLSIKVYLIS